MLPSLFSLSAAYRLLLLFFFSASALNGATLLLEKSTESASVQSGEEFTYTIRYTCQSTTDNCQNVVVKDHLPSEIEYVAHYDTGDVASSAFSAADSNVSWTFNSVLAAGSTGELKVIAKFKEGTTPNGTIAHNVAVGPDGSASNDTTATAASNWTLAKHLVPEDGDQPAGAVYLDRNTTYRVEFCAPANSNIGGLNLQNATMTDTLPAGAVLIDADGGDYNSSAGAITWNLGTLHVGSASVCYGKNPVVQFPSSVFSNNDTVENVVAGAGTPVGESSTPFGPVTVQSTTTTYVFHPHPTPSVGKSAVASDSGSNWIRDDRLGSEQNITYTFTPQNNGNVDLLDFNMTDALPAEVEPYELYTGAYNQSGVVVVYVDDGGGWIVLGTYDRAVNAGVPIDANVQRIALEYGMVSPDFAASVAPSLKVKVIDPGSLSIGDIIHNCASVASDDNASNPLPGVQSCADVSVRDNYSVPRITKSNDTGSRPVAIGSSVTFTLKVENSTEGTGPLEAPVVMDLLPVGLVYNGDQAWNDTDSGFDGTGITFEAIDDYNGTGRTLLRWTFPNGTVFARGASGDLTFSATVENTAGNGTVVNTAYITTNSVTNPFDCGTTGEQNDPYDLDGDNLTSSDVLCYRNSPFDILDVTSLSSQKWVKGILDADFTRYPYTGNTIGGGNADYKLIVRNNGNVPVHNLEILDILPFEGDTGVTRPDENRSTQWRPNLAGPIDMGALSSVATVYYSVAGDPCRAADGYVSQDTPDCEAPEWSTIPPNDISQVYSVKIVFDSSVVLDGNQSLEFTWPMLAPVGSPVNKIAWNSFAFKADRVDGTALLPTEPIKVGIKIKEDQNNSIGDRAWLDINRNGIQDSGEPGVNGVGFRLWDVSGGTPVAISAPISSTDFNGEAGIYRFVNLPDGKRYRVSVTLPDGYILSDPDQTGDLNDSDFGVADHNATADVYFGINAIPDENMTVDAGIYSTTKAAVGDYVWYESGTFNGLQDPGEQPVVGMRVKLYTSDGTLVDTTATNKQGHYLFYGLDPNDYYIEFDLPEGYDAIDANQGADDTIDSDANQTTHRTAVFSLAAGDVDLTRDAGIFMAASVGDYVWHDRDGDGIQDPGESGIGGVTVHLNREADGAVLTTTTESNGSYGFALLHPGDYNITFDWSAVDTNDHPYAVTQKNAGSDPAKDSDGYLNLSNPQQAVTDTTTLDPGENDPTWDLGLYIPASLGDRVWLDYNGDGQQSAESGVTGVTVNLYDRDNGNALVDTSVTDGNGNYLFDNLAPGRYSIEVDAATLPANHVFTLRNHGNNNSDSDVNPANGRTNTGRLYSDEDDMSWDAGVYEPASLGNYIWYDANANGIQDAGEGNISALPVELYYGVGSVPGNGTSTGLNMLTDSNGTYLFDNLRPDTYYIQVDLIGTDYMVTLLNIGNDAQDNDLDNTGKSTDLTLTSGENNTSLDGGLFIPATLGDFVWEDMNRNGIQETGEPGISGVQVELLNALGNVSQTVTTDASGHYRFEHIRPGDYQVRIAVPSGYVLSPKNAVGSSDVNDSDFNSSFVTDQTHLDDNETDLRWDAGLYRYATIGDRVWNDLDADGIQDAGEPGVSGVEVNLTRLSDNTVFTTTTDANGNYTFTNLEPDDYNISFDWAAIDSADRPYQVSPVNAGGNSATDSDGILDPNNAQRAYTHTTSLLSGDNNTSWDLGLYQTARYGDYVWHDVNGNGVQDAMEPGISGVRVTLYNDDNGSITGTTETNVSGAYRFEGLVPGDYHAVFDLNDSDLAGYVATLQNINAADVNDSDADRVSGATAVTTLESGEDDFSWDLGVYRPASIGDMLFYDTDANGIQDPTESGVEDINVSLFDGSDTLVGSQLTDANGNYLFDNLRPDDYYVSIDVSGTDYLISLLDQGGDDTVDSDIVSTDRKTGQSDVTALSDNEHNLSVDAGIYEPAELGDFVWEDLNENGIQDAGEPGVDDITLNLYDENSTFLGNTVTTGGGYYHFTDLEPGRYYVELDKTTLPEDYGLAFKDRGGDDSLDSDANITTGRTGIITLLGGDVYTALDFGILKKRLELNINTYCFNNAPYVEYNISLIGLEPDGLNATMTWSSPDNSEAHVESGLPLSDSAHLWYGAGVNGSGYGNQWPGWEHASDGTWEKIPSDWLRWNADGSDADVNVTFAVNPHTSVSIHYPPTTSTCNPNPPQYGHVFDPPSAKKTVDSSGWPEVEWKMVWINDGNALANRVHVVDPIEANLTYVPGSLECNATGSSVTSNCEYDSGLNAVVWDGAIAPDPGATGEDDALNEVVITFKTAVENNATEVFNQGRAYWDQDGDSNVDMNKSVSTDDPSTDPVADPTVAKEPISVPTLSEWSRIALAAMLLASAWALLYRRREEV